MTTPRPDWLVNGNSRIRLLGIACGLCWPDGGQGLTGLHIYRVDTYMVGEDSSNWLATQYCWMSSSVIGR